MNKIIFLILCWTLKSDFAQGDPCWYPKNSTDVAEKCNDEIPSTLELERSLMTPLPIDNAEIRSNFVCMAKGFNIYSKETGINVDRMAYTFYTTPRQMDCIKPVIQKCVDKYKKETSEGGLIFKIVKCVVDIDNENKGGCKSE